MLHGSPVFGGRVRVLGSPESRAHNLDAPPQTPATPFTRKLHNGREIPLDCVVQELNEYLLQQPIDDSPMYSRVRPGLSSYGAEDFMLSGEYGQRNEHNFRSIFPPRKYCFCMFLIYFSFFEVYFLVFENAESC